MVHFLLLIQYGTFQLMIRVNLSKKVFSKTRQGEKWRDVDYDEQELLLPIGAGGTLPRHRGVCSSSDDNYTSDRSAGFRAG
jgi:hypothetical protein